MRKKECDIIQDLLPSYADEICSEASKEWIEEHLKECEECREVVKRMKQAELSSKQLEFSGLEAAKKWKKKQQRQQSAGYGFCMALIFFLIMLFGFGTVRIPFWGFYVLLSGSIVMTELWMNFLPDTRKRDGFDRFCFVGTLLAAVYGVSLMFFGFESVRMTGQLFFLSAETSGVFLYYQLMGVAAVSGGSYILQLVRSLRKGKLEGWTAELGLCIMLLMILYAEQLGSLTDMDAAVTLMRHTTLLVFVIGGVTILLCHVVLKRKKGTY